MSARGGPWPRRPGGRPDERETPPEPITRLSEVRADHNVVAVITGPGDAREMILHLERSGIDSDHISLLGAQPAPDVESPRGGGLVRTFTGRSAAGAVVGGAVGAALGVVVGVAMSGMWMAVAAGALAVAGGMVGAFASVIGSTSGSQAWTDTFATTEGNLVVGVHTGDADEADRAIELMRQQRPLTINRF